MTRRVIIILLAASLGLNIGLLAASRLHRGHESGPPPGPGGPGGLGDTLPDPMAMVETHVQGMTRQLDLDEQQQQAIRSVLMAHAQPMAELQQAVAASSLLLTRIYAAPGFDADRFAGQAAATASLRSRLDSLSAQMLAAEARVLTPEQRRIFAEVVGGPASVSPGPPDRGGPPPPRGERPPRP